MQETQSYQRIQCIGHTDFKGLSNAVTNTHPLLPSMGTTRQKSSCRNRLQNGPRLLSRVKAGTHSPLLKGSHTAAHTPKHGRFGRGWYHYPRSVLRGSEALRGQVSERRTLPLLRLDPVCSRRTQRAFRTAMRLCASLFRGAAAPLGCVAFFRFCRNYGFHTLCSGLSACARHGRYHYPRRALRAAETLDGRLSKRLICRFLRSGGRSSPHDSYFLANTQNFLLAVPVANTFALWYDKSQIRIFRRGG